MPYYPPAGSGGGVTTANSPNANEFARFTAAAIIEGRTYAEARADLDLEVTVDFPAIPTSSTLGIGAKALCIYTQNTSKTNGSTAAGSTLRLLVGVITTWTPASDAAAVQTGTWMNISGVTQDADATYALGYWVRTV